MAVPLEIKAHSAPRSRPGGQHRRKADRERWLRWFDPLWDADTGKEVRTLTGHAGPVYGVEFAPMAKSGSRAATTARFGSGTSPTEASEGTQGSRRGSSRPSRTRPTGKRVASVSADKSVRVWELADGQENRSANTPGPCTASRCLLTVNGSRPRGADGIVKVWDLAARKELKALKGHEGPVSAVILTVAGPVSAGFDRTLRTWDVDGAKEKAKLGPLSDDPYGLALSKDAATLAVAGTVALSRRGT